jgi:hypothetical protein
MVTIEELAQAALNGDALLLRSLAQDLLQGTPNLSDLRRPSSQDLKVLATAASLAELFAQRLGQEPPQWSKEIGSLEAPVFLLKSAAEMKRLRTLCETQSPEPLRKRLLYAPPNFLEFA